MNELVRGNTIDKLKNTFLSEWDALLAHVKNRVQAKITNIDTISDIIISNNLEEILFGCVVYVNGPVVNKIIQEHFVVTLNRKIK